VAARLETAGHTAWWLGESLHDGLRGVSPDQWSLCTTASAAEIAALLPNAFPCRTRGLAFVVPSASGPVDLAPLGPGIGLDEHLERRGFSVLALAWRPATQHLHDPYEGASDLSRRRLRTVCPPSQSLDEAPLRCLQAARLAALHGYRPEPALEARIPETWREHANTLAAVDLRREVDGLLMSPKPGTGMAMLRAAGIDRWLGFGTAEDSPRLLDVAPRVAALRWAICLRGTSGGSRCLEKLRVASEFAARVRLLLRHHPIEGSAAPRRRRSVQSLLQRLSAADRDLLFGLRESEIRGSDDAEAIGEALALLRLALAREQDERVAPLALDGRAVMQAIGATRAGPEIGRALAFLRARVAEDPSTNTPAGLRELLQTWRGEDSDPPPTLDRIP